MANRLAQSTSPYLIQHANNPVDWYEWGPEALSRARAEDKPIFLSIGYAACHWCHVMAHESFEDPEVAAIMNEHFINIKVDREQRPDIDTIYMTATMAMTGNGGWPMSVFLTPDLQPFYTGTYFPPTPRYNMPSFRDLLNGIARAWREERGEITRISQQVTNHLQSAARWSNAPAIITPPLLDEAAEHLHQTYDWGFGGWGSAPKFPQPMTIEFLFRRSLSSAARPDPVRQKFIGPALHALNAMARGGMYDVVGGGFARYSVDNLWRVPHFEKMLYDNAQLARAYLHAWQLTGEAAYKRTCTETLDFVLRELTHPLGGFYSSLDADSEHEEGKFYVWTAGELQSALGDDYEFFKTAYGITPTGNWEGKTVLQRAVDDATLSARFGLPASGVADKLAACHARLLAVRAGRVRPGTDDKVL
ncbi:MAG: thioredoxin domain-containing protein, partial [Anaerolineales bacterium]